VRPIEDPGRWTISYLGLVATDGSEEAGLASRVAAHLASRTVSELYVIHVFRGDVGAPYPAGSLTREAERSQQQAQALLDRQMEQIKAGGRWPWRGLL
jgi:nucleotide-binding universal stress UspA family protein